MTESKCVLEIPIYDLELTIIVTDDILGSRIMRQDELGIVNDTKDFEFVEGLSSNKHPYYAIFFKTPLTHETIAHEISHSVLRMLHDIGFKFDIDNHEPYSYLVGWITKCVYKFLGDKEIKIH